MKHLKDTQQNRALMKLFMSPDPRDESILNDAERRAMNRKVSDKPRARPEEELQKQICRYLDTLPDLIYYAVPNHLWLGDGDKGTQAAYIARQKAMGLNKGASDLTIIFKGKTHAIIVLPEVKAGSNRASEAQQDFLDRTEALGCFSGVVRSLDEMKNLLRRASYPVPQSA